MPDGSRAQRSTKTTNRKAALKMAIQFEQAAKTHLTEVQARRVIADIYRNHSGRRLESASIKDYLTRWASLRKRLKILRVALQQAWRDGLIDQNPAAKVPTIRVAHQVAERRAFTVDELKRILAVAETEWKGLILAGLYSGQRLGDLARLQWSDIDMNSKTLSLTTRKTSRRQILPVPKPWLAWLTSAHAATTNKAGPVFPEAVASLGPNDRTGTLSNQFRKTPTSTPRCSAKQPSCCRT